VILDVHAHYYPPAYFERLGRELSLPPTAPLGSQSLAERLDLLDRTGVDAQLLSIGNAQPYLPSRKDAQDAARVLNDELADVCEQHPGRFRALAALPLPHVDESLAEIERAAGLAPVVGYTLGCSVGGQQLDDAGFVPVLEELDRRRATVLLHPVGGGSGPGLEGYNLSWLVGAPFEDTLTALRLVLSGTVERFCALRFVVPHLGGTIPFVFARLGRLARQPGVLEGLRSLYYDTVSGSVASLACACATIGADRLLFGTDYPFGDEAQFVHHLEHLSHAGLAAAELRAVAGERAVALFGLEV